MSHQVQMNDEKNDGKKCLAPLIKPLVFQLVHDCL